MRRLAFRPLLPHLEYRYIYGALTKPGGRFEAMNLAARVPAHTGEPALAARSPARSLEQRRLQFYLAQIVTDIVLLLSSFMLTGQVYRGDPFALSIFLPAQLCCPST